MPDVLVVYGTRPEAIKLGPVVAALRERGVDVGTLCTGQHTSLLAGTPSFDDLLGESLNIESDGDVVRWITRAQKALISYFLRPDGKPQFVVVQGDTMSAGVAADAARGAGIPVIHVEAGLRSHNESDPWPEERTRVSIAKKASVQYAPTSQALANLVAEGVSLPKIKVTGNTVVSAMARYAPDVGFVPEPEPVILITLHRREVRAKTATGNLVDMLYRGLLEQANEYKHLTFVWALHPAVEKLLDRSNEPDNVELIAPVPYREFLPMVAGAMGIVTDSGGLVEEATTLGVPTVILRNTNDRPEAEEVGVAVRMPLSVDGLKRGITMLATRQLVRLPSHVFGTAEAANIIADDIARRVEPRDA